MTAVQEKIHWKRIGAEAAAIVISILLAFAVDAWWEGLQEAQTAHEHLEAVLSEFESNQVELPRFIDRHQRLLAAVVELSQLLDGPVGSVEVTDTLLVWPLVNISFDAQRGALNSLLASDGLRLIRNTELRAALAGWPTELDDAAENEELQTLETRPRVTDSLTPQVSVFRILSSFRANGPMMSSGTVRVRREMELRGRLEATAVHSINAISEYEPLLARGDSITDMIRSELAR